MSGTMWKRGSASTGMRVDEASLTAAVSPRAEPLAARIIGIAAERQNLQAAASYALLGDRRGDASLIVAAMHSYLRSDGHWDQAQSLYQAVIGSARDAGDQVAEAGSPQRVRLIGGAASLHHLLGRRPHPLMILGHDVSVVLDGHSDVLVPRPG